MTNQPTKNTQDLRDLVCGTAVPMLTILTGFPATLNSEGPFTTAVSLICFSCVWVGFGILPLYIEERTLPVFVATLIIVVLGSGMGGLGIAILLKTLVLGTETFLTGNWLSAVTSVLASLALLAFGFIVLKTTPITHSLLIGTTLIVLVGGYSLGCGIFSIVESIVYGTSQIASVWKYGMSAVLHGVTTVVWILLITRQIVDRNPRTRFAVPLFIVCGGGYIVIGISYIIGSTVP